MTLNDRPQGGAETSVARRLETAVLDFAPQGARILSLTVQYGPAGADVATATTSVRLVRATRTLMFVEAELQSEPGQLAGSASAVVAL